MSLELETIPLSADSGLLLILTYRPIPSNTASYSSSSTFIAASRKAPEPQVGSKTFRVANVSQAVSSVVGEVWVDNQSTAN